MHIVLDLGGTTVDAILFENTIDDIVAYKTLPSDQVNKTDLGNLFDAFEIDLQSIDGIILTGGKNRQFENEYQGKKIEKYSEIDCIGAGGLCLSGQKKALVVSMGTGTCMVSSENESYEHIGGTGIGGGTLMGLGQLLLENNQPENIEALSQKGDLSQVDLTVEDIIGGGIGIIPGSATASNFGKLQNARQEDLALGICNIIGQTISAMANFAAQTKNQNTIVLIGKLTRITKIVELVKNTAKLYNREIIVPEHSGFGTAIGAIYLFNNSLKRELS